MKTKERILLVDDDLAFLHVYQGLLSQHFDVEMTQDPQQALELVRTSGLFAVIISDMHMPGMDGIDFLAQVGRMSPRTVKIMLTGQADLETAMAAVNISGVFGFFSKGCDSAELVDKVRQAIAEFRRRTGRRTEAFPTSGILTKEERDFFSEKD